MGMKPENNATRASRMIGGRGKYVLNVTEPVADKLCPRLIVNLQLSGLEQQPLDISLCGNVLTIKELVKDPVTTPLHRPAIIGESRKLQRCLDQVLWAARQDESVLICGETGTGKELLARAIHQNSWRAKETFVVVDCSSLPEAIAEQLLLGRQQNNRSTTEGLIAQAERGTLFLDEIGDLPMATQKLFNLLLSEQKYRPGDGCTEVATGFRLIVTTNRDLEQLVRQGKFNRDLLSLLQPLLIEIPPLRERADDIDLLTDYFMQSYCRTRGLPIKVRSPEFMAMLKKYPWPGNVRELENSLEQALLSAKTKKTLFPVDLPAHIRVQVTKSSFGRKKIVTDDYDRTPMFGGFFAAETPL